MPCCVKCPYLVKCCPKLPPFSISANNNFPRFSSIGAIIFSSDSPNASCSTYITAPANYHNPRCFNSQVYLGGPIPHKLGEGFDAPPTLERSGSKHRRKALKALNPLLTAFRKSRPKIKAACNDSNTTQNYVHSFHNYFFLKCYQQTVLRK